MGLFAGVQIMKSREEPTGGYTKDWRERWRGVNSWPGGGGSKNGRRGVGNFEGI